MSRKMWSKVKESELVQTIKEYPLATILSIVFAFTSFFLISIVVIFGLVAVISEEMLKALIEAEATILGFFGLITVYALNSLDTRIDRLEQQIFDIQIRSMKQRNQVIFEGLPNKIERIQKIKGRVIHYALCASILLVGSLLSSILGLGIPIEGWAFFLCSLSVLLFFLGIGLTLLMIYDLAET